MKAETTLELNWKRLDPEARWGFKGKKYTGVSNHTSILLGAVLTGLFYAALYPLYLQDQWQLVNMFFHGGSANRSTIPYYTVFLSCWCLAFLWIKAKKLKVQKKALAVNVGGENDAYVISPMNAQTFMKRLKLQAIRTEDFMVLWRMECALSNLRNIGRVADVSSFMSDLASGDAEYVDSSYTLPRGLIWAIPVLGFIGTVLGLSEAVGGFGTVVASGADLEGLKQALGGVTGGLSTAFETTLIALVAALIIQLLMTLLQHAEEEFLNDCSAYCRDNLTSHLKLLDVNDDLSGADTMRQ